MLRKTLSASLLAAMYLATPALAEEVTVGRPIEGAVLHQGRLDMAVYFVPVDGVLLEVTATFAPKGGGDAQRMVMGRSTPTATPWPSPCRAIRTRSTRFTRAGETVTVSSGSAQVCGPNRACTDPEQSTSPDAGPSPPNANR